MAHTHPHDSGEESSAARFWTLGSLIYFAFAVVVVGLLVAYSASFQVREGTNAVVTQFGKPIREVEQAGLYWKWPWPIQRVHPIDMRLRLFNTPHTETFTQDKTNVILLTYAVWRVEDPLLFLQSLGEPEAAERKLISVVAAAKHENMGNYPLSALVCSDPARIRTAELEQDILQQAQKSMQRLGVRVEQVGIKRIAYPKQNMTAALNHMRAERRKLADLYRAQGTNQAKIILSAALEKKAEILRVGQERAGEIRGQAESEAAAIIEKFQSLDPEFYHYWRSLEVLKKTLGPKASIVLRNDQRPFDVLTDPPQPSRSEPIGPPSDGAPAAQPPTRQTGRPREPGEVSHGR